MSLSAVKLLKQLRENARTPRSDASGNTTGGSAPAVAASAAAGATTPLGPPLERVGLALPPAPLDPASGCLLPCVPSVAYVPDALTAGDEGALLDAILARTPQERWVQLRHRRLQMWGGTVTPAGLVDAEPLPPWAVSIVDGLMAAGLYPPSCRPNHLLVNEYAPGQGIMPHTDGPAYFPRTTTLSLGSPAIMRLAPRGGGGGGDGGGFRPTVEVVLQRRSLVAFGDAAYSDYLHAISEDLEEVVGASAPVANAAAAGVADGDVLPRALRVSLTFRCVPVPGQPRPWATAATTEAAAGGNPDGEVGS